MILLLFLIGKSIAGKRTEGDAQQYFRNGVGFSENQEYNKAIDYLSKAIDIWPSFPSAYLERGYAFRQLNKLDEALYDFTKAIELDPHNAYSYYERAIVQEIKRDYDKAILDYTYSIKLKEDFDTAYFFRGIVREKKGELENAIKDYSQAINISPKDSMYLFKRGLAKHNLGQYKESVEDYEKAINLDPKNLQAYNNYSWLLSTCPSEEIRDGKKAFALAKKAIEIEKNASTLDTLAAAYAELGDFDSAIEIQYGVISSLKKNTGKKVPPEVVNRLKAYKMKLPWRD